MTNPYGYQAQPQGMGSVGYPPRLPPRNPNGATAIIAGLLGLALCGLVGYLPVYTFIEIPSGISIGDLPGEALTVLGLYLAAAILLLIGAVVTLFRSVVGAVLLIIGATLALTSVLLEPALLYRSEYGMFFEMTFQFESDTAFSRVGAIVLAPIVLLLAALPPTFRYLKHKPLPQGVYGPRQGYPAPQQGYPPYQGGQPPAW
ncbi:hypothetical protein SAMN05216266_12481 [Amycolatopsis marina]|uniref:Uncharacterized protein n=1 Tax=Amycolatopsis marina TaxID=490629 RepID=A0A1I1CBU4_9PSEU|nr:hypothetical protein [Amycolatopsis marina]SFB59867.1 hypothetical protein SAMN05216266_12481 [Amycolatopsis marina]